MVYAAYNSLLRLAAPLGALWLRRSPKHRLLLARFRPPVPAMDGPALWVHACSVGEVNTARPILEALRKRFPGLPLLLTVSTASGYDLAHKTITGAHVTWLPFDTRPALRNFLREAKPRALALIETELWPNTLRECRRHGVPAIVINGRLSDKHYTRYRRHRWFFRPVFRQLAAAGVQNEEYAQRFTSLGLPAQRVTVTGNTKFDGVTTAVSPKIRSRLRAENGFHPGHPLLLFGSTRPGDEALAAEIWAQLRDAFPELRIAVAPRHLDRIGEAIAPFHESILRRSQVKAGQRPGEERVFFLDTVGELVHFYAIASIAVVGGSFHPGVNGHNPLEPAALGIPTVFGPFMSNFPDPARVLVEARGAIQLCSPGELLPALRELLFAPEEGRQLGTRGRKAVLDNQGAIQRNVDLIAGTMSPGS